MPARRRGVSPRSCAAARSSGGAQRGTGLGGLLREPVQHGLGRFPFAERIREQQEVDLPELPRAASHDGGGDGCQVLVQGVGVVLACLVGEDQVGFERPDGLDVRFGAGPDLRDGLNCGGLVGVGVLQVLGDGALGPGCGGGSDRAHAQGQHGVGLASGRMTTLVGAALIVVSPC